MYTETMFDDLITPPIQTFDGEYAFLSNFYPAPLVWDGMRWSTSEHAYQAAKTLDVQQRQAIQALTNPAFAKRAGKTVSMRSNWNDIKVGIMREIVHAKFEQNISLRQKLIATGDAVLEEGNTWRDRVWGICPPRSGQGRNELGKILMEVRTRWVCGQS